MFDLFFLEQNLEMIYKVSLFLSNAPFIITLIIFGIFCIDRDVFIKTTLISIGSAFVCAYLKYVFQVPLNPDLGKIGYAFPSGHTMFNFVFWASLIWQSRSAFLLLIAMIIIPINYFAMVYFGYHTWSDIFAGIGFSIPIILFFIIWEFSYASLTGLAIIVGLLSISSHYMLTFDTQYHIINYSWVGFYYGAYAAIITLMLVEEKYEQILISKMSFKSLLLMLISATLFLVSAQSHFLGVGVLSTAIQSYLSFAIGLVAIPCIAHIIKRKTTYERRVY